MKVFSACDVEFVTRTRTEHLSEAEKKKFKGNRPSLHHHHKNFVYMYVGGGLKKLLGLSGDSDQEKTEENVCDAYIRSPGTLRDYLSP